MNEREAGPRALVAEPARTQRSVAYLLDLAGAALDLARVDGEERLSKPPRFVATLVTDTPEAFEPESICGQPAVLRLVVDGADVRWIAVCVTEASVAATRSGSPDLQVVLERRFALLRHKSDARVFVDRSVPDMVEEVLAEAGVVSARRLRQTYAPRPYTLQARETDLAFVSRLLEEEGIHYFFLDDADATMVLGDSSAAYDPLPGRRSIPFRATAGLERNEEMILALRRRASLAPSAVTLRDWDPARPGLDLEARSPGPTPAGAPYYDFPGHHTDPEEGARRARLLAESFAHQAAHHAGDSDCARLAPGRAFTLTGDAPTTPDGGYVVTSLRHRYDAGRPYVNSFEALPEDVAFRPPRDTPKPVLSNPVTAFVTGPDGEDIHTDELGRVKIRFPWTPRCPGDDTSSSWVPVVQDNTGHSVGIPRIGWEVVVHFVDGNPDRPVVLGRVYNGTDPFPEPLPAKKTSSALRSQSSMKGALAPTTSANMMRMDDAGGAEQLYIQAQKDQNVVVANDKDEKILAAELDSVGGDETIAIGRDQTVKVGGDRGGMVVQNQKVAVAVSRSLAVGGSDATTVAKDRVVVVGGTHARRIEATDTVRAKSVAEKVGAVDLEASLLANQTMAAKAMITLAAGASIEVAAKDKTEMVTGKRAETVGGLLYTAVGKELTVKATTTRTTTVGGALVVTAAAKALLGAKGQLEVKALTGELAGGNKLVLQVGPHKLSLSGTEICLETPGNIRIAADANAVLAAAKANENG